MRYSFPGRARHAYAVWLTCLLMSGICHAAVNAIANGPIGWVTQVEDSRIHTNIPVDGPVQEGALLSVYRVQEVTHPRTGVVLSIVELEIAEATLAGSAPDGAVAVVTSQNQPVQPFDLLRLIPPAISEQPSVPSGPRHPWVEFGSALVGVALTVHYHRQANINYSRYLGASDADSAAEYRRATLRNDRWSVLSGITTGVAVAFLVKALITSAKD